MAYTGFQSALQHGLAGESLVAKYLRRRGWFVLPVYEVTKGQYRGPRLYGPTGELVAPDMFVFRGSEAWWIEVKHKDAFALHRNTNTLTTGIDLPHYEDYCLIDDTTPWHVVLFFLHDGGQAKDSPPDTPSGLFGASLQYLRRNEHHRHRNGGRYGMVYWALDIFKHYATLEEIAK